METITADCAEVMATEKLNELAPILADIRKAIVVPICLNPVYHKSLLERHRRQYPHLWNALDRLLPLIPENVTPTVSPQSGSASL